MGYWDCGCGWSNGINLDVCARCKRTPGEAGAELYEARPMKADPELLSELAQLRASIDLLQRTIVARS